eukprot:1526043-Amphidinium_carterae.1
MRVRKEQHAKAAHVKSEPRNIVTQVDPRKRFRYDYNDNWTLWGTGVVVTATTLTALPIYSL